MTSIPCACTCDYDSVTGETHNYVCDWCQEEMEGNEGVEALSTYNLITTCNVCEDLYYDEQEEDRCYCASVNDNDGYRFVQWECNMCSAPAPALADPADPWAVEKNTIRAFLTEFGSTWGRRSPSASVREALYISSHD